MSLVELMVGMLIGLIGIIVITHLYLTNEQYKRSTTGAGTAQVNGAIALYSLERDLRMAGWGINHTGALDCTCVGAGCSPLTYYYNGTYSYPPAASVAAGRPSLTLAPVVITETANQPDTITVLFGTASQRMLPGVLSAAVTSSDPTLHMDGVAGYAANDMVVATQGTSCVLMQVTGVVTASQYMTRTTASLWNPAGVGSLPALATGALVFNLGTPVWRTYSVDTTNKRLRFIDVLTGTVVGGAETPIIDDIVDIQAQYGKDAAGNDGVVDAWDTTTPATSAGWSQVLAVRIGVLARSPNYVKTPGVDCDATTAAPTWSGGNLGAGLDFATATSDDRCYKYRVFETIVPLRNMIWRPA